MDMMGLNRKRGDGTWMKWMQWREWREHMKSMQLRKRRKAAVGTWLVDGVLWIALSLLTLLLPSLSWGATYYVTQAGAGDKSGTTYAKAMGVTEHNAATFAAGDAIYLCGTITSSIVPPSAGESGNPIVYDGACPGYPGVIDGQNAIRWGIGNGVKIGSIHLTIKNLEIKNIASGAASGAGIWVRSPVSGAAAYTGDLYVTIDNCIIHDIIGDTGYAVGGIDSRGIGLTVTNSTIYNVTYDGIYSDGSHFTAGNNHIYNVDYGHPGDAGGDCIQIGTQADAWVHHNIFDHSYVGTKSCFIGSNTAAVEGAGLIYEYNTCLQGTAIAGVANVGVTSQDPTNGQTIRWSSFSGCRQSAIVYGNTDIYGNTFANSTVADKYAVQLGSTTAADITLNVYNNTFYNMTAGVTFDDKAGFVVNVKNNIFHTVTKAIWQQTGNAATTRVLDYNVYYGVDDVDAGTNSYSTGGQGAHNLTSDPLLASNFHLLLGSPAINAGVNVCTGEGVPYSTCTGSGTGTWTDIKGSVVPHNGKISIGAYQFTSFDTEKGESAARKSWRRVFRKF